MKKRLSYLTLLLLIGLSTTAQEYNRVIYPEGTNTPMLIGTCNRDAFAMPDFITWFENEYENYQPEKAYIDTLSQMSFEDVSVIIVLGTWCPDSRREVPRFFRIMDDLGIQDERIKILCLDRSKSIPGEDISDLEVYFVPTFILFRNEKEIGRIVEMPEYNIEMDLFNILE